MCSSATVRSPRQPVNVKTAIADCDIHPARATGTELYPFLAKRWHAHLETYGKQAYHGMMEGPPYPKAQPNASRRDAWPPEGGPQGSSLSFMQKQLLDPYNVALGVLNPLNSGQGLRNQDLAGAICSAINDWQIEKWTSKDKRLKGSIVVANEDGVTAAAEIRKRAGDPNFVQVLLLSPQCRAARPAPLLAGLRGGAGDRPAGRRPRLRLRRQSAHPVWVAELLHRGNGRPCAMPADRAGEPRARRRVRALSKAEDGDDRGRLRLGAVAGAGGWTRVSSGCTARCRI